ncbi:hypothetical protein NDU88_005670 [Pleurodeles waltl]|uniref:H-type lectin domain-containing protein n=1 Tax=Pleurodeles waltl TaxID=8319 RepID=A0AAV7QLX9_PLEWA|nr:hypothetical protein NDU88_005670 [Pleurodeles waltl]
MSSRQRKGKGGHGTPYTRSSEEVNSTPQPLRESRSPSSRIAASSSSRVQVLLWPLLALLAGALGTLAWLHLAQRDGLRELQQELLSLRNRLPRELEGLKEQMLREQEDKVSESVALEQRLSEMEGAWKVLDQKLEEVTAEVEQTLASDAFGKLSDLQSQVKKSLDDIREEFPSSGDLAQLETQVELIRSTHMEKLAQDIAQILSDHSGMKENLTSLTAWYSNLVVSMQANSQSLQDLRQDIGAVSDSLESSLEFLSERVGALESGSSQALHAVEMLQSQLERSKEDLAGLREVAANQRQDQTTDSQQLENIREMIRQLDLEKSHTEEEVNSIRHSIADQKREAQNEVSVLNSALGVLQTRMAQVESGATSQNVKLSEALELELQSLRKGLDKVDSGIQQCLSGEVQTYCETPDNCGWPHLREVNFPHRVLTEPTITLGVSGLSAQGSVGVTVKAIDITDAGFKIQISNIGDHHLSSVRVTWMLCA